LRDEIFIPTGNFFAFVLQSQREAELGADAIAVGPNMADDANGFAFANDFENAVNDFWIRLHFTVRSLRGLPQKINWNWRFSFVLVRVI
jgi:hypothetical protein